MKTTALILATAACLWAPQSASADMLELHGEVMAGGAHGQGVGGAQTDNAFHAGAAPITYGFAVGAEVFFVDGWVQHNQYRNSEGLVGTWTQFMAGVDTEFDLGAKTEGGTTDEEGKTTGKYSPVYGEVGMAVGFGVGTGQQVDPPLDNSEVTDKGFLFQVHFGFGYRLTRALSLGVIVPVQGAYMFKNGVANDLGTHYQSAQGAAMLNLRLSFNLK